MKHFVARCLTLCALLGPVALAPLVAPAPAYSLNDDQIQAKLKEVPGFALTGPDDRFLTISINGKDGKPVATIVPVYLAPKDAENALKNLQSSSPQLAKGARIIALSLAQVRALYKDFVKQDSKFSFELTPDQTQYQAAVAILKSQGIKDDDIKKLGLFVPVFSVGFEVSGKPGYVTVQKTTPSGKVDSVTPFFLDNQFASNILNQAKKQSNEFTQSLKVNVANLPFILQQLEDAKPDSPWAGIELVPSQESIGYAMKLQSSTGKLSPASNSLQAK